MRHLAKTIALTGLAVTIVTPVLATLELVTLGLTKTVMLVAMAVWFIGATPWLAWSKSGAADSEAEP